MKGKVIGLVVAVLALGVVFGIVAACPPPPPEQPQCPPGTIEVTPAQFVAEVTQLQHRHRQFFMWGSWSAGACHGYGTCQERTVVIAEAYWIDPVCRDPIPGCMDANALNFNPAAEIDDGSCIPVVLGCTDKVALNFDPEANTDDGTCNYDVFGCMDPKAVNFNQAATVDDGTCLLQSAIPFLDVACREDKNWAFVTPVFGDGVVSIEIVGVATYFPPTGQAVQLAENTYEFVAVLAEGYVGEGLTGTFDVPLCPVRRILPKTAW